MGLQIWDISLSLSVLRSIMMVLFFLGVGGLQVGGKTGENAIVCFLDACKEIVQGVCFFGLSS